MRALCALALVAGCAPVGRAAICRDAARAKTLVSSDAARRFVAVMSQLPEVETRILRRPAKPPLLADEDFFYQGKYGTPVAYARAVDLMAAHGFAPGPGVRLLDFGYGAIGQLRALALLGVDAVGVDVDPLLPLLYAGAGGALGRRGGRVTLVDGHWPGDAAVTAQVGGGFDVIISKNTLKRGYLHPDRPADEKKLIHLGVGDDAFLAAVLASLKPGGLFLIYNICPALTPPDKPFVPWSDGRSPFSRAQLQAAGFEVIAFDVDDSVEMRRLARAFQWDRGVDRMDLEHDFSTLYTLMQKPAAQLPK